MRRTSLKRRSLLATGNPVRLPSLPESLRVSRFRWPLLVLLGSIGLTAIAAIDAQRAIRSQRLLAQRALRDYAGFAAWSYAQHLLATFNAMEREVVGAVNHGDNLHTNPRVPEARDLAHYMPWDERCLCHRPRVGPSPDGFFAIKIGSPQLDIGVNTHPFPDQGWEVDRPLSVGISGSTNPTIAESYSAPEREWLVDSLTQQIRGLGEVNRGFTLVVAELDSAPRIFAYTLMPTSWGDTMVYGARYSKPSFVQVLGNVLDGNGLLPAAFVGGRRNRDILSVRVRDRSGNVLFESGPGIAEASAAHVDLPARAGALGIDAMIRPELAGTLLVGGLPRSRLPFLFGLLGLAAALSIVAVMQLRREGELAQVRAEFVSSVSHELRTPVAQIRLYLETLQLGRASTEEQRRWSLGHIERETTRLSHLVENVLRFSTLGRGDEALQQSVNVADEVSRIVDEFRPLAASRSATIRLKTTSTPTLALTPDALRHILLNLLDNAVKYGPVGQTVSVSVDPAGSNVQITVSDEGPGVTESERQRIWRPFTRGDAARATGGSGIGLTVVAEVVKANGGRVSIEPADGRHAGAKFVVSLPVSTSVVRT